MALRRIPPFPAAVLASTLALAGAWVLSTSLRGRERMRSTQEAMDEHWHESRIQSSPTMLAAGRKLFLNNCAHCHGADATGDEGPDLHDVATSDRYIKNIILRGIPHEMPSFKKKLHPEDVLALLVYVRSLNTDRSLVSVGE